jgi:hypothetical protein
MDGEPHRVAARKRVTNEFNGERQKLRFLDSESVSSVVKESGSTQPTRLPPQKRAGQKREHYEST